MKEVKGRSPPPVPHSFLSRDDLWLLNKAPISLHHTERKNKVEESKGEVIKGHNTVYDSGRIISVVALEHWEPGRISPSYTGQLSGI